MTVEDTTQSQHGSRAVRPGAMTVAMQAAHAQPTGPTVLRVCVIVAGKIIEERILRARETVAVGSSERNHFVIHGPSVPARFELFELTGDDYALNFTAAMSGKVSLAGGVCDLAQTVTDGSAQRVDDHFQLALSDNSRGRVVLGTTTFLFQFVHPPPVQPRPQLPVAVRSGVLRSIDWMFTGLLALSFMSMFGLVVYLEHADYPMEQGIASVPEEVARLIFEEPPPPEPVEQPPQQDSAPAPTPVKEAPAPAPPRASEAEPDTSPEPEAQQAQRAERTARIAMETAQAAEALIVGALGSQTGGALADVLAGGAVTGKAEDILAQASGVGVAQSAAGGTLRTRSGGSTGSGQEGLGALSRHGGAETTAGRAEGSQVVEREIRGRTEVGAGEDIGGSGEFDASLVVKMIKNRIGAIRACYERELKRNPTLAGKVTVQFTIEQQGNVSGVKVVDNTTGEAAVGTCVANAVQRFRFSPGPEGGSVSFSYPFVFAPQR
jgi:TonB family protein